MAHWTNDYIGREHTNRFDCAELVMLVMREHYGKEVAVPSTRAYYERGNNYNDTIKEYVFSLFERVEIPQDGDVVLMANGRNLNHVGVFVVLEGRNYVLHNLERVGVILQKAKDVNKYTLQVEGYYRLKEEVEQIKDDPLNGTNCKDEEPALSN